MVSPDQKVRGRGSTYKFADRMLEPGMRDEEQKRENFESRWWEEEI